MEISAIKSQAIDAVKKAGRLVLEKDHQGIDLTSKGFKNFVTEADYAVESFLRSELLQILPQSNLISEESDKNTFDLSKPTWVLDPIDGTTNFIHGYRQSAVSLALFVDGQPVLGFIYNPFSDEMFVGEKGKGSELNGKEIFVSGRESIEDCLIGFGTTPYDREKAHDTFMVTEKIFQSCRDVRRSGSAALDIAFVASGRMDAFFEMTLQPWDFCAGLVILKEAGGRFTDLKGSEVEFLKAGSFVATNSKIHDSMLELLKGL